VELSLITEKSAWWIVVCLIFSLSVSILFYIRSKQTIQLSKTKSWILGTLRFLSLFIISILLLNPIIKTIQKEIKKPILIFAQDNSQSIIQGNDSTFIKTKYKDGVLSLLDELKRKFEVHAFEFGDEVTEGLTFSFNEEQTNIGQVFDLLKTQFYNQNIGALIIASDGINNRGSDPLESNNLSQPLIYTIGLGDTLPRCDISIKNMEYNKVVFKGNKFPVFVNVVANQLMDKNGVVKILSGNRTIDKQQFTIDQDHYFHKFTFLLNAEKTGKQPYQVQIEAIDGEENLLNNDQQLVVDVREDKLKILYLQESWHPDAAAFDQVLSAYPGYQFEIVDASDFKGKAEDYALIILHQLPSNEHNISSLLKKAMEHEIPLLFILGEKSSVAALNQLNVGISIQQINNGFDDVRPVLNPTFSVFTHSFDPTLPESFPPLRVPFGNYNTPPTSNILFYQQIGTIQTEKPLIFFASTGNEKTGFICGEGIWRWRISEYSATRAHELTNELILKTVQYLSLKNKKEQFKLEAPDVISENQNIVFNARLYNASHELINEPEINLELFDEQQHKFQYVFQKNNLDYVLNAGRKVAGSYTYKAATRIGDRELSKEGSIIVQKTRLELMNLQANHKMLFQLASLRQGTLVMPGHLEQLKELIENNKNISSFILSKKGFNDLINFKGLFVLVFLLLTAEWFLRKYWGTI